MGSEMCIRDSIWNDEQCRVLFYVLNKCAEFSEELTVAEVHVSPRIASSVARLFKELPDSTSFVFYGVLYGSCYEDLRKTCGEKLTFALFADVGKGVSKLPDFGLSSVVLGFVVHWAHLHCERLRICCYTNVCALFLLLYMEMNRNRLLRRSQEALQEKVLSSSLICASSEILVSVELIYWSRVF